MLRTQKTRYVKRGFKERRGVAYECVHALQNRLCILHADIIVQIL